MQRRLGRIMAMALCTLLPCAHAADVAVPAFDGHLLGSDVGEWIGRLEYVARDGARQTILEENILGIVNGASGVFAISGLAHMSTNRGAIYRIDRRDDGTLSASVMVTLAGAPSQVRTHLDGTADFLVFEGWLGERQHFRCYRLADAAVQPANTCTPPAR